MSRSEPYRLRQGVYQINTRSLKSRGEEVANDEKGGHAIRAAEYKKTLYRGR